MYVYVCVVFIYRYGFLCYQINATYELRHGKVKSPHYLWFLTYTKGEYEALEKYGKDLTTVSSAVRMDPFIGIWDTTRQEDYSRLMPWI